MWLFRAEDRAELLEAIDDEADRLDRLVDNLLDASRLEAGGLVPHNRRTCELIQAVLVRLRILLGERVVRLDIQTRYAAGELRLWPGGPDLDEPGRKRGSPYAAGLADRISTLG